MRDPKPGQTLYLYVGQRTKGCRKLGEAVCESVQAIEVWQSWANSGMSVGGKLVSQRKAEWIARADGFEDLGALKEFLLTTHHELPFEGILIRWYWLGV